MRLIAAGSACRFQVRLSRTTTSIHRCERKKKKLEKNWKKGKKRLQKDENRINCSCNICPVCKYVRAYAGRCVSRGRLITNWIPPPQIIDVLYIYVYKYMETSREPPPPPEPKSFLFSSSKPFFQWQQIRQIPERIIILPLSYRLQSPVTGMEPSMRLFAVGQAGASMICRSGNRGRHNAELAVHDFRIMMISTKKKKGRVFVTCMPRHVCYSATKRFKSSIFCGDEGGMLT